MVLDATEHLLDRAISNAGALNGDRSLKNRDALRVLVENRVDIFCSPKGVIYVRLSTC